MSDKVSLAKEVLWSRILENKYLTGEVYSMVLHYPGMKQERAMAGQFINVYLNRKDLLLPRPISICRVRENTIQIIYKVSGEGTKELATYEVGTFLKISSPLGTGYDVSFLNGRSETGPVLIVGGGIGIPPLLELAYRLKAMNIKTRALLCFKDEPFLIEEFKDADAEVHVATENGCMGFKGNALDLLKDILDEGNIEKDFPAACFACGPQPMLKALSGYCMSYGIDIRVSLEERMGCGYGACVGCVCKIKSKSGIVQKKVCKDGPVFDGSEVVWDA